MDKRFDFPVGSANVDQSLEFAANSVYIDNPTNQWLRLDSLGVTIPQYTIGAIYPLPGTTKAQFSYTAPAGQAEPPIIAGQGASLTFYALALAPTSGVGMLGGRAPYYDRNPLSISIQFSTTGLGPHASTVRASYTVPAGRRAYQEFAFLFVELDTVAGDLVGGIADSFLRFTTAGGVAVFPAIAEIIGLSVVRTQSGIAVGSSIELQPGEKLELLTQNTYTATTIRPVLSLKATEFDV